MLAVCEGWKPTLVPDRLRSPIASGIGAVADRFLLVPLETPSFLGAGWLSLIVLGGMTCWRTGCRKKTNVDRGVLMEVDLEAFRLRGLEYEVHGAEVGSRTMPFISKLVSS